MELEWEIGSIHLFAWAGERRSLHGARPLDLGLRASRPNPAGHCSTTITQTCVINSDCARPALPELQSAARPAWA